MAEPTRQLAIAEFLHRLAHAPAALLVLDYDGTLAPFQRERMEARPYPGVLARLARLGQLARTQQQFCLPADLQCGFVLLSGRPADEVAELLRPLEGFAVHGAHGLELRRADGSRHRLPLAPADAAALGAAEQRMQAALQQTALPGVELECKPGGVALHWRGLASAAASEEQQEHATDTTALAALARQLWEPLLAGSSLRLLPFDGGLELRVTRPDKGDALRTILDGLPENACVAYLGDDQTDEDAFLALQAAGARGLGVLVRAERRPTAAHAWVEPPDGLLAFLDAYRNAHPAANPAANLAVGQTSPKA